MKLFRVLTTAFMAALIAVMVLAYVWAEEPTKRPAVLIVLTVYAIMLLVLAWMPHRGEA